MSSRKKIETLTEVYQLRSLGVVSITNERYGEQPNYDPEREMIRGKQVSFLT
jgi:hypothetical protein